MATPEIIPDEMLHDGPAGGGTGGIVGMAVALLTLGALYIAVPMLALAIIAVALWIASSDRVVRFTQGRLPYSHTTFLVQVGAVVGTLCGVTYSLLAHQVAGSRDASYDLLSGVRYGGLGLLLGIVTGLQWAHERKQPGQARVKSQWASRQVGTVFTLVLLGWGCIWISYRQGFVLPPSLLPIALGTAFVLAGVAVWILVLRESRLAHRLDHLVTTGVYSRTRNPVYLALMLVVIGVMFFSRALLALFWACISAYVLRAIAKLEENDLERAFGEEYLEYKREVPMLLPRLRD
jgi:protein-S-isoprenylcysteine O-methyltransferase Ste14